MSADPLTIHGLGSDLNAYAYVHGQVLRATDPLGLSAVDSSTGQTIRAPVTEQGGTAAVHVAASKPHAVPRMAPTGGNPEALAKGWDSFVQGFKQAGSDFLGGLKGLGDHLLKPIDALKQFASGNILGGLGTLGQMGMDQGMMAAEGAKPALSLVPGIGSAMVIHEGIRALEKATDIGSAAVGGDFGPAGRAVGTAGIDVGISVLLGSAGKMLGAATGPLGLSHKKTAMTRSFVPSLSHVNGKTAKLRNRMIQEVLDDELKGLKLTYKPEYNPFLEPLGVSQHGLGTQIGPRSFLNRWELMDTIIHEELHHRWWKRKIASPHHGPATGPRFDKVIERYKRIIRKQQQQRAGAGK